MKVFLKKKTNTMRAQICLTKLFQSCDEVFGFMIGNYDGGMIERPKRKNNNNSKFI